MADYTGRQLHATARSHYFTSRVQAASQTLTRSSPVQPSIRRLAATPHIRSSKLSLAGVMH